MFRNKSVDTHAFSMIPRADIPRASFRMQTAHKTTFNAGLLIPVFSEEVLPGDTWNVKMTAFCRLQTLVYPLMDNLHLESFFFFIPNRLVWSNWVKFMGEQNSPSDSISYTVPVVATPTNGGSIGGLGDYFGLPTTPMLTASINVNSLPLRGYNLVWNQWFRDENLQNAAIVNATSDGPDTWGNYLVKRRGKRHDYFTSCLPFVQKGTSVPLPLGTQAPVKTNATDLVTGAQAALRMSGAVAGGALTANMAYGTGAAGPTSNAMNVSTVAAGGTPVPVYPANLYADLSAATAATINQIRQAFQIQKLLERDARGGTRYTEIVRSHFGVISPDARLQRTEYLGGGHTPVNVRAVEQTQATGGTTPLGQLAGYGMAVGHGHGFSQSFTEHGYILGLVHVRADLTYQQGLRKMWSRATRYDFYFPVFSHLGEQAVLNKEIFVQGNATDNDAFGYQERWAEYRHSPPKITGLFRSTAAGTLDAWHAAQVFGSVPTLNDAFISDTPPLARLLAAGAAADNAQLLADLFFDMKVARPLPVFSVPGLVDHF